MRSGKFGILLASAAIGPMTAAEREKGRYMRAPDHPSAEDEFAAFERSGTVEVGEGPKPADAPKPKPRVPRVPRQPAKPAAPAAKPQTATAPGVEETQSGEEVDAHADDEDEEGEDQEAGDEGEEGEEETEPKPKPKPKASDRIRELNKRLRESERARAATDARLTALEKGGLPAQNGGDKKPAIGEAPDPTDAAKYPLGHLDERYVEDRIQYLVKQTAGEQADAVLQREQETRAADTQRQQQEALLGKADDLAARGSEQYDDFQEAVIDTGLKGDWRLEQPTFEAAHEAEHGAQILYELSQDKTEAARVAGLSVYGQTKFVMDRNAELAAKAKPRRIPGAGAPPQTQTRGANSRTSIKPDTDNLDDFAKAWANDAKGK